MKVETKITLTFMIMFVVSVIIGGINNAVVYGDSFFALDTWTFAVSFALVYLIYIWIETRKHKRLAVLGFVVGGVLTILLLLTYANAMDFSITNVDFSIARTIMIIVKVIYCWVAYLIAERQSKELLEEDALNVNVNITLIDNTKPNPEDLSD